MAAYAPSDAPQAAASTKPRAFLRCQVRRIAGEGGQAGIRVMHGHHPISMVEREVAAHMAAHVAARRAERGIAEDAHHLGPWARDGNGVEGWVGGTVGVPVARQVGHNHVERVGGIGPVCARIGKKGDDLGVAPNESGQPWLSTSGSTGPDGATALACTKFTLRSPNATRHRESRASAVSCADQSKPSAQ
jgi:hypothetical protein